MAVAIEQSQGFSEDGQTVDRRLEKAIVWDNLRQVLPIRLDGPAVF